MNIIKDINTQINMMNFKTEYACTFRVNPVYEIDKLKQSLRQSVICHIHNYIVDLTSEISNEIEEIKSLNKNNEAKNKKLIELKLETALTWIKDESSQRLVAEALHLLKKL